MRDKNAGIFIDAYLRNQYVVCIFILPLLACYCEHTALPYIIQFCHSCWICSCRFIHSRVAPMTWDCASPEENV